MRKMIQHTLRGKQIFVGIEDSKSTWKVCVRSGGLEVSYTSMPTKYDMLLAYFKNRFPECKIHCIYEAGFKGFGLHDRLVKDGIECTVIPPHLVTEAKVSKVKTDKRDARRLAKILENHDYKNGCYVPDAERREDRQVSRTLIGIQSDIVAVKNRIKMMLYFHGIEAPFAQKSTWTPKHFRQLRELAVGENIKLSLGIWIDQLEALWKSRDTLRKELRKLAQKERYKKAFAIIQSMPGIGWFTAIRLVLEWGEDLSRFASGKQIASFIGLTAKEDSTGETVQRGGITHLGSGFVRSWLIECAWTAIKKDAALLDKFNRVWRACGKKKVAIVAVARMMAVRLRACVLSGKPYVLGIVE
jgi:transposase